MALCCRSSITEAGASAPEQARRTLSPLTRIGDCNAPGTIQAAVLSGDMHARLLLGQITDARDYKRDFVAADALRI